ncbi:MAG: glycosyltransferase family 4 protein [Chloroflexi bacterium]|nr:glycosyltransferase family 4 protein [Chloroflexota bacterium]
MQSTSPTVLFVSGREPDYVRNSIALRSLSARYGIVDLTSSQAHYPSRLASVSLKTLQALLWRRPRYDVAFAGFLGQPLAPLLRSLQRRPVVLDAFLSVYDTLAFDRQVVSPVSPGGRAAFLLDWLACRFSTIITVDTAAQARYFSVMFGVPLAKTRVVYLGADLDVFRPVSLAGSPDSPFVVFYHGSYLPLHGVHVILGAAKQLEAQPGLRFVLVGRGQTYARVRQLAAELRLSNVQFVDWIPYGELPAAIARASVCLGGHFGVTGKARRTIAGKTFQYLAMGRPTIVADAVANRELFTPDEHVVVCPPGDPSALAAAILRLRDDPDLRASVAAQGRSLIAERFSADRLADDWSVPVAAALSTDRR